MYYALCEDVYLVKGSAKSCIYDLTSSRMFSINNFLANKIELVNRGDIQENNVENELKSVLDDFIQLGLIEKTDKPIARDINEIKEKNITCKFAWIEITSKCNLKCTHCYNESDVRCDSVMSLPDFQRVIDILVKMNVPKVQIIGGEPFWDKKILKDMLDYAIGKFEFIEIFTNGTLITNEWFDYLKSNNINVALSVYSYEPLMHDKVTQVSGSFKKTNKTIELLQQRGISYRVCNVLMKDISLGKRTSDLFVLSDKKDIVRMSGRANFKLLSDELIKKKLISKQTFQKPIKKAFCKRLISGHNCFKDKIYISANLDVYPCVMERRLKHCTIDEKNQITLKDNIRFLTKDGIKECSECEYRYACYDCRPNSLSGDIYEKPWYCTYRPKIGEWEDEDLFIERLKEEWGEH